MNSVVSSSFQVFAVTVLSVSLTVSLYFVSKPKLYCLKVRGGLHHPSSFLWLCAPSIELSKAESQSLS